MIGSSAELFRNELSQRLCADADFSLPNANILVGVIIDAMEYNLSARYRPLARATIQNVLKVSDEIACLGRILQVNTQFTHRSVNTIPPLMLRTLYMLAIPATSLLSPSPEVVTLIMYVEVVHRLSSYIGPRAVYGLVRDFNRMIPRKLDAKIVTKVPGTGPRVVKGREGDDVMGPARMGWGTDVEHSPYPVSRNPHPYARPIPFPPPGAPHPYASRRMVYRDAHRRHEPPTAPMISTPWDVGYSTSHHTAPVLHHPHPVRYWEALPLAGVATSVAASVPSSVGSFGLLVNPPESSPDPRHAAEESPIDESSAQSPSSCASTSLPETATDDGRPESASSPAEPGIDN